MKIFLEQSKEWKDMDFKGNCADLADKLGLNLEEYLIVVDGNIVTADAVLNGSEEVKFLSVVSGG